LFIFEKILRNKYLKRKIFLLILLYLFGLMIGAEKRNKRRIEKQEKLISEGKK
jgi:hypothetical protein